jgi:hypothetical protein
VAECRARFHGALQQLAPTTKDLLAVINEIQAIGRGAQLPEDDRDGAVSIGGEGRATVVIFNKAGRVAAADNRAQGDTGCLIIGNKQIARLTRLADRLRRKTLKFEVNQQIVELEGADIAEIVAVGETVVTALVDAGQAYRHRCRANRIVALIDRGAANL